MRSKRSKISTCRFAEIKKARDPGVPAPSTCSAVARSSSGSFLLGSGDGPDAPVPGIEHGCDRPPRDVRLDALQYVMGRFLAMSDDDLLDPVRAFDVGVGQGRELKQYRIVFRLRRNAHSLLR